MKNALNQFIADPGPIPEHFSYGNGKGNNSPINCQHCGIPLVYYRPGDWWHAPNSSNGMYMCCDKSDLVPEATEIADGRAYLVVTIPMRQGLVAQLQQFLDDEHISHASLELVQRQAL